MKLESIPAGYQDVYIGVANEDFENPEIVNKIGDGDPAVEELDPAVSPDNPEGKKNALKLIVRAGTVGGNTAFSVRVDGHVGDGDAPVDNEFDYDTISADATSVSFTKVRREPIP